MPHYDLFISHASEDKQSFVQPLATALATLGVLVWYDDFALLAGDSLSRSIDRGLADSRYGVVILSPSFIRKPWPEYELRGLVSKELGRDKVIIPVWFGLSRDDVLAFSPPLADKVAIGADRLSLDEVAAEILHIVRPDIHSQFRRLLLAKQLADDGVPVRVDRIVSGRVRHSEFPKMLMSRINLIRHIFFDFMPGTLEEALLDFRHDTHPEQEIVMWEAMAAVYLDYLHEHRPSPAKRRAAFDVLLHLSTSQFPSEPLSQWSVLDSTDLRFLRDRWDMFGSHVPVGLQSPQGDA